MKVKELRFKIGDFVVTKGNKICCIIGYNHHCGGQDYTINYLEKWGNFSSCYGANDEDFIRLYEIQDKDNFSGAKK